MQTTDQPVIVSPLQPPEPRLHIGSILRDVVIVWVLTFMGGLVVGVATGGPHGDMERFMAALAVANLLFGTVAFTIVGCLAPCGRWRHLSFVALGTWITGLINVFFGISFEEWVGGAIPLAIVMGIGGAISYLFKRDKNASAERAAVSDTAK
jgi:hypothetical protein